MTASRFLRFSVFLACLLQISLASTDVAALNQIRDEEWSYRGELPQYPASSVVSVGFFANVGDMDLPSRVVFTLNVINAEGEYQPLVEYRWGRWEEIAAPGTPITAYASFRLSCDGDGQVIVEPVETWFGFCNRGQIELDVRELENVQIFPVQVQGRFGLGLVDRGGYLGPNPTPRDAFGCAGAAGMSLDAATAAREVSIQKSRAANAISNGNTGSVGLYFDPLGQTCSGTILPDQPGTVYVVAKMAGMSECGIAGAEFRFTGIPDSWMTFPVAIPDILAIGDPLADGATMGFKCKRPEAGLIVLYSVQVLAMEELHDLQFAIERRNPPADPDFDCPLLVLCDYPAFTMVCVNGFTCNVNATEPRLCAVPTGVEAKTWSGIKTLFR